MPTDNTAAIAAMLEQMAAMQKALNALMAPAPAPTPAPAPVAAPPKAAAIAAPALVPVSASFVDSQGVEWIAEGIKRWNYGIDQATLLPPVALPAGGHRGWWNSGDPYKYQQRDPAFLHAELNRIEREWAARQPASAPTPFIPGATY